MTGIAEIGVYLSYGLLIIAVLAVLIGFALTLMYDFKSGIFSLAGLLAVVVIFAIAYLMSSGKVSEGAAKLGFGEGTVKLVSGGLMTVYILVILTVIALVGDLVRNIIQGN